MSSIRTTLRARGNSLKRVVELGSRSRTNTASAVPMACIVGFQGRSLPSAEHEGRIIRWYKLN